MSFDLAIFYSSRPLLKQEVSERYIALCERDANDMITLQELIEPDIRLVDFCTELLAMYPPLTLVADDDDDNSPWCCDPDVSDGHIIVSIRWSMCKYIAPLISEMALKRGFMVFDPQDSKVYLPPSLGNAE